MIQVLINNESADLYPSTVVAVTKQINDVRQLAGRQADFTNNFKLPPTQKNDRIFENARLPFSNSIKPYRILECSVLHDGVEVVRNGVGYLRQTQEGDYQLVVTNALRSLFDVIGNKMITELTDNSLDHVMTLANIYAARSNTSGYLYPLINYGGLQMASFVIPVNEMLPAVTFDKVFSEIFNDAGFTKEGIFGSYSRENNLIIPYSRKSFVFEDDYQDQVASVGQNGDDTHSSLSVSLPVKLQLDNAINDPGGNLNTGSGNWYYGPLKNTAVKFRATVDYSSVGAGSFIFRIIEGFSGDVLTTTAVINSPATQTTVEMETDYYPGTTGKIFRIELVPTSGPPTSVTTYQAATVLHAIIDDSRPREGVKCEMMRNLPEISQKDFILAACNLFNMVPLVEDPDRPTHIAFRDFDDVWTTAKEVQDWSAYLVNKRPTVTWRRDKYAQNNYFRWKEDKDNPIGLGDSFFTIDDQTLPQTEDVIKMPYAASQRSVVCYGYVNTIEVRQFDAQNNNSWRGTEPRLAILRTVSLPGGAGPLSWQNGWHTPSTSTTAKEAFFIDATEADELDAATILSDYYTGLIASLERPLQITASFLLPATVINKLDHLKTVHVQQFGGNFYVNKVINYRQNVPVEVELIRV